MLTTGRRFQRFTRAAFPADSTRLRGKNVDLRCPRRAKGLRQFDGHQPEALDYVPRRFGNVIQFQRNWVEVKIGSSRTARNGCSAVFAPVPIKVPVKAHRLCRRRFERNPSRALVPKPLPRP